MTNNVAGRDKRFLDFATLVRNWGWYLLVMHLSGKTPVELDEEFLGIKRVKAPERSSRFGDGLAHGRSPDEFPARKLGKTLYRAVTDSGAYREAQQWFESTLWRILMLPDLQRSDYSDLVLDLCNEMGLDPRDPESEVLARLNLVMSYPPHYPASAWRFSDPDANDIAILCAWYREAYLTPQARSGIEDCLAQSLQGFFKAPPLSSECRGRLKFKHDLKQLLHLLIEHRVLNNYWIWRENVPKDLRNERNDLEQLEWAVQWYITNHQVTTPLFAPKQHGRGGVR